MVIIFHIQIILKLISTGNRMVLLLQVQKITKTGFFNYCWPGCLTVMYDVEKVGLIQIADIKK